VFKLPLDTVAIPSETRLPDKRFLKLKHHELLPNPCGDVILCMGSTGSGKSFDEVVVRTGTADIVAT